MIIFNPIGVIRVAKAGEEVISDDLTPVQGKTFESIRTILPSSHHRGARRYHWE